MIPYLLLLLYIIIVCSLNIKNKKVALLLCLVPFFVFMASQQGWTPDYDDYERYYDEAKDYWQVSYFALKLEFLYAWLEHIMPTYRLLIVTQMALYTTALYILFYYHIPKKYWIVSFILFFLDYNMLLMSVSAIRSCIVASLFVIAYHLKSLRYKVPPVVLVIISVFFHKSALLLLPFILIPKRINKNIFNILLASVIIIAVIAFFSPSSFNQTLNVFLTENEELSGYTYYTNAQTHTLGNFIVQLISAACAFYVISIAIKNKDISPIYEDFVFICAIFILVLRIIPDLGMTTRFVNYFGPIFLVCNAKILQMDRQKLSYFYVGYSIIFAIYYMARFVTSMEAWNSISSYKSVLF